MARRLFAIFSILSFVLCLAAAFLWVRSYWVIDSLVWLNDSRMVEVSRWVSAREGAIHIERDTTTWHDPAARDRIWQHIHESQKQYGWSYPPQGFSYQRSNVPSPRSGPPKYKFWDFQCSSGRTRSSNIASFDESRISFPLWPIAILTGICPAIWIVRFMRVQRRSVVVPRPVGLALVCTFAAGAILLVLNDVLLFVRLDSAVLPLWIAAGAAFTGFAGKRACLAALGVQLFYCVWVVYSDPTYLDELLKRGELNNPVRGFFSIPAVAFAILPGLLGYLFLRLTRRESQPKGFEVLVQPSRGEI